MLDRNNITSLHLLITDKCNLRCKFCFVAQCGKLNKNHYLTEKQITEWFKTFDHNKDYIVSILGGEPLLHPQVTAIIKFFLAQPNILKVILSTNGAIWKEELANLLENQWNKKRIIVQISLQAFKRYRQITGSCGNVNGVLRNIVRYQAIADVALNTVLYDENLDDLNSILDFVHAAKLPIGVRRAEGVKLSMPDNVFEEKVMKIISCHPVKPKRMMLLPDCWKTCGKRYKTSLYLWPDRRKTYCTFHPKSLVRGNKFLEN